MEPITHQSGKAEICEAPRTYPGMVESRATRATFSEREDAYMDDNRHELFLLADGEKKVTWEEDSRKFSSIASTSRFEEKKD
jgi:hypothetical protein